MVAFNLAQFSKAQTHVDDLLRNAMHSFHTRSELLLRRRMYVDRRRRIRKRLVLNQVLYLRKKH